jgi:cytochrome c2
MRLILRHSWLLIAIILAGCGTFAPTIRQVTTSTAVAEAHLSNIQTIQESTAIPTETPLPPTATTEPTLTPTDEPIATLEPTATPTDKPTPTLEPTEETVSLQSIIASHDPENGSELFQTLQVDAGFACSTCHNSESENRLIGPGLLNVGSRAETRVEGQSGLEYIYTSITNPSEFVVPEFPDDLMPKNWQEIYSEDEIYDIIAYLLTLKS